MPKIDIAKAVVRTKGVYPHPHRKVTDGREKAALGNVAGLTQFAVNFKLDVDADGIALVTWDAPGRSMNVIDLKTIEELSTIVERVISDAAIKGAVITSRKETFCAGADLTMLEVYSREFADMAKA